MNTTTITRLESIRDDVKPTPADRSWRDSIIAREVARNGAAIKAELAELTGLGIPQINRIARTVEPAADDREEGEAALAAFSGIGTDAPTIHVEAEDVTFVVVDTTKPKAKKPAPRAPLGDADKPEAIPTRTGRFEKAPAGGHVPPRARKIRSTGSVVEFGHASDMGEKIDGAGEWVSRCLTHNALATFETRGEARYQDGTEYCLDCASIVGR